MVFMPEPIIPTSAPIKTFQDLLNWKPGQDEYNIAHTPFHPRPTPFARRAESSLSSSPENKTTPGLSQAGLRDCKVIVCHDMAGGYVEDARPQGNDYGSIYSIQYWNHVDIFIYFSHYRITIPPPVWTNAAHKNGVRSIGTIITEWLPGILETDEMVSGPGQTLADEDGNDTVDRRWFSKTYADKLVDVAVYYKFDGWFINIESILRGGVKQVNQTIAFLRYLREQIHQRIPGGELHWYDSVITSTGEIAWQDKLSPENYRFFEQSDGIFTNYTWGESAVGESVALAGPRNRDVYTGIDIWGRNTFGGGGFTTYKALEVIQRERTSCALFAPAWTYESLGKEEFMTNDRLFWAGYSGAGFHAENLPLSSFYLTTCRMLALKPQKAVRKKGDKDKDKDTDKDDEDNRSFLPVSAYIPLRPSGCATWFYSNFDRGFGKGFWINGKKVSDKPWSHLSHQSLSPSLSKEVFSIERGHTALPLPGAPKAVRWVLSPHEAYNGGTSLVVQEFSLDSSTPPLPPLPIPPPPPPTTPPPPSTPPRDDTRKAPTVSSDTSPMGAADIVHATRTRSIIVPLFDTQIALLNALDSTIELVFKSCQTDVQVGVHLGMMAAEKEKDDHSGGKTTTTFARKLAEHELLNLLEPSIKAQWEVNPSVQDGSFISSKAAFLSLGAIEGVDQSKHLETLLALDVTPEGGFVDAIETLEGGWCRLTLHISSLFSTSAVGGEKRPDLSSIFLSQLGLTLTYEGQAAPSEAPEKEEFRPLVVVGSLAVVPTWSAVYKGSCVQGLKADASQFVVVERKDKTDATIESGRGQQQQHQQQHALSEVAVHSQTALGSNNSVLKVSSTVTWNVGYPIVAPTLRSLHKAPSSSVLDQPVSSVDYSHYAVYLSLEPRDSTVDTLTMCKVGGRDEKEEEEEEEEDRVLMFVGTAFTNQFQIVQFEVPLDQVVLPPPSPPPEGPVPQLPAPDGVTTTAATAATVMDVQRLLTTTELMDPSRRSIWAWVQGIRRDGRADEQQDWALGELL